MGTTTETKRTTQTIIRLWLERAMVTKQRVACGCRQNNNYASQFTALHHGSKLTLNTSWAPSNTWQVGSSGVALLFIFIYLFGMVAAPQTFFTIDGKCDRSERERNTGELFAFFSFSSVPWKLLFSGARGVRGRERQNDGSREEVKAKGRGDFAQAECQNGTIFATVSFHCQFLCLLIFHTATLYE